MPFPMAPQLLVGVQVPGQGHPMCMAPCSALLSSFGSISVLGTGSLLAGSEEGLCCARRRVHAYIQTRAASSGEADSEIAFASPRTQS